MRKRKILKRLGWTLTSIFAIMNVLAIFHSYKFTHYTESSKPRLIASKLSGADIAKIVVFGIDNPRPVNTAKPSQPYEKVKIQSNKELECWSIKTANAKGTIILFHGYGGEKSGMLDKSDEFIKMGYNTLLVDFMGSGGSEGNQTTIGYKEAQQVKSCYEYIKQRDNKNIHLFGTSMGAVAIMKAIQDYDIEPASILIECPFGSFYKTVCARFKIVGAPTFPVADLMVFWGGLQNGFWAFGHNPTEYTKAINCPALLLYGEQDNRVSREEINEIYSNLNGKKQLATYPLAGHENYLIKYKQKWTKDVSVFLENK